MLLLCVCVQFMTEKIGKDEGTQIDEEFKHMEKVKGLSIPC